MYKTGDKVKLLNSQTSKLFYITKVFDSDVSYHTNQGESKLFALKGDLIIESEDKLVTHVTSPQFVSKAL